MKEKIFGVVLGIFLICTCLMPEITRAEQELEQFNNLVTADHVLIGESSFDLVVYGGDAEGVVAALTGARNGLKTLLVMEEDGPGGLLVYGALNFLDLNYDSRGKVINKGIFAEWHRMVGNDVIVDIEQAREAFAQLLLAEENLTIVTTNSLREVELSADQKQILSLTFESVGISKSHDLRQILARTHHPIWKKVAENSDPKAALWRIKPGISWKIRAKTYIDATQDADLAAMAQAAFFFGGADIGIPDRKMAVTLVFSVKNVNWNDLKEDVQTDKWGYSKMNQSSAWGFGKLGQGYQPVNPQIKLRGLNIALQQNGHVFINALQIFDLDVLDPHSLAQGMEKAQAEVPYVVEYLKENLAGFQDVELLAYPPQLYVRESRHILALYQLDLLDLIENVDFFDKIALASYPVDYQATTPKDGGFVVFNPGVYSIPFRSLVPKEKDNLLVVGRSAGYSSLAAGSTRVIPTGMATAEAAGIAAALSIELAKDFPQIAEERELITELQNRLERGGVDLHYHKETNEIVQDKDYDVLAELFSWGMIVAGYDNQLYLERVIREREFAFILTKGMKVRQADNYTEYLAGGLYSLSTYAPLYRNKACELLLAAGGYWLAEVADPYQTALDDGFIPATLMDSLREDRLLTRRDVYLLVNHFLQRYPIPEQIEQLRTRSLIQNQKSH